MVNVSFVTSFFLYKIALISNHFNITSKSTNSTDINMKIHRTPHLFDPQSNYFKPLMDR